MKFEFIGPTSNARDASVYDLAQLDSQDLVLCFRDEVLDAVDSTVTCGDVLEHFINHQFEILSTSGSKISSVYVHDGSIPILSSDLAYWGSFGRLHLVMSRLCTSR